MNANDPHQREKMAHYRFASSFELYVNKLQRDLISYMEYVGQKGPVDFTTAHELKNDVCASYGSLSIAVPALWARAEAETQKIWDDASKVWDDASPSES